MNFITKLLKAIFRSGAAITTPAVIPKEIVLQPEIKTVEQQWFQRQNNLVAEFTADPVPVYSSDFSNSEPIGWQMDDGTIIRIPGENKLLKKAHKGFMVMDMTPQGLQSKMTAIDRGETHGFMTLERYYAEAEMVEKGEMEKEELLIDDVELIKDKTIPEIPLEEKAANYIEHMKRLELEMKKGD